MWGKAASGGLDTQSIREQPQAEFGERGFSYQACHRWNKVPDTTSEMAMNSF